jgi:mono/diheme cytochrome c family protein
VPAEAKRTGVSVRPGSLAARVVPTLPAALAALALLAALATLAAPPLHAQSAGPAASATGSPAAAPAAAPDAAAVKRGAYIYRAAGGCGCHTNSREHGAELAGGRPIKTPFGTFYAPNLTPDPETGLGRWSEADFVRAMREGVAPNGSDYFPVFPYTSFTQMTDGDLHDLWAFLRAQPPVHQPNKPHDVLPPFGWRVGAGLWKRLFFRPTRFAPDPQRSAAWNRGAYLSQAVAHCGECHTPRNLAGALKASLRYAGSADGPEGELAPNITPDKDTGIGKYTAKDLAYLLETGFRPDGNDVQGLMAGAIENGYGQISPEDRLAIADYVLSLPPIHNKVLAPPKKKK